MFGRHHEQRSSEVVHSGGVDTWLGVCHQPARVIRALCDIKGRVFDPVILPEKDLELFLTLHVVLNVPFQLIQFIVPV